MLVAGLLAASASASLFFLFDPTSAGPNERVTVRLGGTPASFTPDARNLPLQRAMRLYLVPNDVARTVRSRFDKRLHFVGALVPDRDQRGILTFTVPPLDSGTYAVAVWCPACGPSSRGRTFFVLPVARNDPGRFAHLQLLDVRMPDVNASCPVTTGLHGNGFLRVSLSDGVYSMRRDEDGTLFNKLGWLPKKGFAGNLTVRGERLDAPGTLRVLSVNWGQMIVNGRAVRGSWMSAVKFPSEGCWRLTGRVSDISLSYVVKAVAAP
jgi:hypothetical protein